MERKLKASLVLGASYSQRALELLSSLNDVIDTRAFGLLSEISKDSYLTEIPLQTFMEDKHLPGFMLGLEDELSGSDIIIASGLSENPVYQAFRFAYHQQKPFVIFCQSETELKQALLKQASDFEDCVRYASGFIFYDDAVRETLEFMGVESEKLHQLTPEIDVRRYGYHEKLRKRFRDYLKISSDVKVIVSPLSDDSRPLEIMAAFKMLEALDYNLFAQSKLVFVGDIDSKEKIKYRAVDLGLTKSLLFIAQDFKPFFLDLMAAADLYLAFSHEGDSAESMFGTLEAMASGAYVLTNLANPLASALPEEQVIASTHQTSLKLRSALLQEKSRDEAIEFVATHFGPCGGRENFLDFLKNRVASKPGKNSLSGDFTQVLQNLQGMVHGEPEVFEKAYEKALHQYGEPGEYRGKLLLLRAQMLLSAHQLDEALLAFEQCTMETSVQREAFMGLGRIAFYTHSHEEALTFYRKSLALKPNDPEAMGNIGVVYRKMGLADEAVYWLGKAISVDVESSKFLNALTQACLESEDVERSLSFMEQLKVLLGNKPALVMCLGQLYFKAGNTQKGKELVDLALAISEAAPAGLAA